MSDSFENAANPHQKLEFLLEEALDLPPSQRDAFYQELEQREPDLVAELKSLVSASEEADDYFDQMGGVVSEMAENVTHQNKPLQKIGPYPIIECLGMGSMGAVYLVDEGGRYGRRKAAKLLKSTWQSEEITTRFQAEDYTLALMDHHNIVRVDHTGTTENGLPYFIMEYVEGEAVTDYCLKRNLPLAQRLELFRQVCDGVLHAHQKGVIHRDLKPSNIMITEQDGKPVAKIIDFGIAKILTDSFAGNAYETQMGTIAGTPAYMSPEQAGSGNPVDTRSDIYSLGLILYEMLTGCKPMGFDRFTSASLLEQLDIIQKIEPPKPSKRVLRMPNKQAVSDRLLRGDLDRIILKALAKEPNRRYSSISGLRRDITHYLTGQPVEAGSPGNLYRLGKLIRRYKAVAAALMITMLSLLLALSFSIEGKRRAETAEAETRAELNKNKAILGMLERILQTPHPNQQGGEVTVSEALLLGEEMLAEELTGQEPLEREVRQVLGDSFFGQGLYTNANRQFTRVIELDQTLDNVTEADRLTARLKHHQSQHRLGAIVEAEAGLRRLLPRAETLGRDHILVLDIQRELGFLLYRTGRFEEAEVCYRYVLEIQEQTVASQAAVAATLHGLAKNALSRGRLQESEDLFKQALQIQLKELGENHPSRLKTRHNYGILLNETTRHEEAETLFRDVIKKRIRILGADHPDILSSRRQLAETLLSMGKTEQAGKQLTELLADYQEQYGPDHRDVMETRQLLSRTYYRMGDLDAAVSEYRALLTDFKRAGRSDHADAMAAKNNLGDALIALGRHQEAIPILLAVVASRESSLGLNHRKTILSRCTLAEAYQGAGDLTTAERTFRQVDSAAIAANLPLAGAFRAYLANCLIDLDRMDEAATLLRDSYQRLKKQKSPHLRVTNGFIKRYESLSGQPLFPETKKP